MQVSLYYFSADTFFPNLSIEKNDIDCETGVIPTPKEHLVEMLRYRGEVDVEVHDYVFLTPGALKTLHEAMAQIDFWHFCQFVGIMRSNIDKARKLILENGDYESASRLTLEQAWNIVRETAKVRRDAGEQTVSARVDEAIDNAIAASGPAVIRHGQELLHAIEDHYRQCYRERVEGAITSNDDVFAERAGETYQQVKDEIADLEDRLQKARTRLKELKNEQVVEFVDSGEGFDDEDGTSHPIEPSVASEIREKALGNEFFSRSKSPRLNNL